MTYYPEYVLITDLRSAEAAILRRRHYPSPSRAVLPGEYENVANGQLAEMRNLFTDLTKADTPDNDGGKADGRCGKTGPEPYRYRCGLDTGHTGPHIIAGEPTP